jgi:hypothetical protein
MLIAYMIGRMVAISIPQPYVSVDNVIPSCADTHIREAAVAHAEGLPHFL